MCIHYTYMYKWIGIRKEAALTIHVNTICNRRAYLFVQDTATSFCYGINNGDKSNENRVKIEQQLFRREAENERDESLKQQMCCRKRRRDREGKMDREMETRSSSSTS